MNTGITNSLATLDGIKPRRVSARTREALAANRELIPFYLGTGATKVMIPFGQQPVDQIPSLKSRRLIGPLHES